MSGTLDISNRDHHIIGHVTSAGVVIDRQGVKRGTVEPLGDYSWTEVKDREGRMVGKVFGDGEIRDTNWVRGKVGLYGRVTNLDQNWVGDVHNMSTSPSDVETLRAGGGALLLLLSED